MSANAAAHSQWAAELERHWGIAAPLSLVHGEYDLNFAVDSSPGRVLKVMRAGCDPALVDVQVACLAHLADTAPDLPVPQVIADRAGRAVVELRDRTGTPRLAWLTSRLPGTVYATTRPQTLGLIEAVGRALGRLDAALAGFRHPALERPLKWDLRRAGAARAHLTLVTDAARRARLAEVLDGFDACRPALDALPPQALHNDLNDYNILCATAADGRQRLTGLVDFGDMLAAPVVCELAIAGAYLMLDQPRPVAAFAALVAGYHAERPLAAAEIELLWPLALTRLAVSALNAAAMRRERPGDAYVAISQAPIERFFARLPRLFEPFARASLRRSAGYEPATGAAPVAAWLGAPGPCARVFDHDLGAAPVLDLGVAGEHAPHDPLQPDLGELAAAVAEASPAGGPVLGRYGEPRLLYATPAFFAGPHPASERRTVHLGIDVFLPAGTPVRAPLEATVHSVEHCPDPFDYGGLVTLRHAVPGGHFFTLYGHLAASVTRDLSAGRKIAAGEAFATLGSADENGGWPPHLHLQVGVFEAPGSAWPGVADPDEWPCWRALCPDPAPLLGLAAGHASATELDHEALLARRRARTAANLKLSYAEPLTLLRGWRSYLFDERGRTYLDAFNNVPHVGHAHPRIAAVVSRQSQLLNTNTRYLHPLLSDYADALVARLPAPLEVCFLLNSASEANELALRLARARTEARDMIVSAAGYHGHTCATIDLSDYKFSGPGGGGRAPWVHVAPIPDTYRGRFKADNRDAGPHYAAAVADIVRDLRARGRRLAGFISEPFPSVGGQIVPPPGYLRAAYAHVREAGGVCIADEVQTGLGRLGRFAWGFEQQGAVPDVVVLGKPIGNGHPLAAVITTRAIADSFANGMEFFSTFGGSTLSCAVGLEVLRILDEERLAENAQVVGERLLAGLSDIAATTAAIGDVRGLGFFLGVELVAQDGSPDRAAAAYVVNRLRRQRVLIGSEGPHDNVLKIRPPLCFSAADAEFFLARAAGVFDEMPLRR